MFYIDQQDLVTDAVLLVVEGAVQADPPVDRGELRAALSRIVSQMDTVRVFDREPTEIERSELCERLLLGAVLRTLTACGYSHVERGYLSTLEDNPNLDVELFAIDLVPINFASPSQLDGLPGVGPVRAAEIMKERGRGAFTSVEDLVGRVDGIGQEGGELLASAVSFRFPEAKHRPLPPVRSLAEAIELLVAATPGSSAGSRLLAALVQVEMTLAPKLPPAVVDIPQFVDSGPAAGFPLEAVEVLFGSQYFFRVLELIDSATSSVDVCMFHIALPSDEHPTRRLIDGLLTAHERGVQVRVLLDQDRTNDPYRSTVINSAARNVLNADTMLCRFDKESVLLHSKFLVVDNDMVVIGSHNWSAGSFFGFDDLSVVVHSPAYVEAMSARFDVQWAGAE